jgi:hypothetical protein
MKPQKVAFYVYAESEEEVKDLQKTLNDFVRDRYDSGILVTAKSLGIAIKKFGSNFLVTNFLKNNGK